jgi:hypothetical protein
MNCLEVKQLLMCTLTFQISVLENLDCESGSCSEPVCPGCGQTWFQTSGTPDVDLYHVLEGEISPYEFNFHPLVGILLSSAHVPCYEHTPVCVYSLYTCISSFHQVWLCLGTAPLSCLLYDLGFPSSLVFVWAFFCKNSLCLIWCFSFW